MDFDNFVLKNIFLTQAIRIFFIGVISFLTSLIISFFTIELLKKIKLGKKVTREEAPIFSSIHSKKEGTITGGGIGFIFTTIFITFLFAILDKIYGGFWSFLNYFSRSEVYLPFLMIILAGLVGFIDDILGILKIGYKNGGLGWKEKFIIYFALGFFVTWWFYVKLSRDHIFVPFIGDIDIGVFYFIFTLFVILGSIHGANLTDGLDGLLIGVSAPAFLALILISFFNNYFNLAAFLTVFLFSILGFLWFNFYPAKSFMGDVGSVSIGVLIGTVSSMLNVQFYLIFFVFIFVIEALSVILQVLSKKIFKKKIFISAPLHHHFEALGIAEPNITFKFWVVNSIFCGLGLIIYFISKLL
jgi:phospho-N-acetylmuramoyl-pentapeptide-transferase